ncbi:hypothetical protein M409DRAFT_26235 [Zasmidium cellare ATCC 36951]|uniref:Cyanovirin-N domain-containing protein n=1 Tax=Zasmidium cellare ATCC 36951 TaxID=1080233 RepID=A0A6A6CBP3_ZASCE|nr:uncharacterized protein M409DRAFT_26235 [Zasmidium cellare ATCC 36951]KAF2163628.1 hypothetical protein M409DRAFT_26235 [Zasmidium cellare ATCC 36951]
MQFLALVLPIAAFMASTAYGAECYSQSKRKECLNSNDLYNARQDYCGSFRFQQNGEKDYFGQNGWKEAFTGTNIPNQQLCWDSTDNIIKQCLGHKNGGSYSQNGWNMNINFCA